jgi:hypothetical protein
MAAHAAASAEVGIDEGGLILRAVEGDAYIEVGGLPGDGDEEYESDEEVPFVVGREPWRDETGALLIWRQHESGTHWTAGRYAIWPRDHAGQRSRALERASAGGGQLHFRYA